MASKSTTASSTPSRLTRDEAKEETRRLVLEAAEAVFRRDGYHGATLDRIAAEAGFTKGAVYSTFDSKADVMLALVAARAEARRAAWDEVLRGVSSVEEFVTEVSRRNAGEIASERDWHFALAEFVIVVGRDEKLRARYYELHEANLSAMATSTSTWMRDGDWSWKGSPKALAVVVSALAKGLVLEGLIAPAEVGEELVVEAHLTLLRGARISASGEADDG